jgi:hypothetical protein
MQSSNGSKFKTRKTNLLKTKLQKKMNWLEFSRKLRGSIKNNKPSQEDKKQLSVLKPDDSTLTEKV